MSLNWPVRRIATVGTRVIGASWAAQYLARGFDVIASDPDLNAEANLRRFAKPGRAKSVMIFTGRQHSK